MIPEYPSFIQNLQFILIGFAVVLFVLFLLSILTQLMGRFLSKPECPASCERKDVSLSRKHIAAISAAIHTVLGENVKIVSVKPMVSNWAQEGRRQHFSSHKLR